MGLPPLFLIGVRHADCRRHGAAASFPEASDRLIPADPASPPLPGAAAPWPPSEAQER